LTTQDIKNIIISTYDFVGSVYGEQYRGMPSEILPTVADVINSRNTLYINSKIDATENLLAQNNLLTPREAAMIQEIQNIFTTGSQLNMTSAQAGPYFANKLQALRTKYKNIVWNVNEGEGFLGMLSIAESSNEYWHLGTTLQNPSTKVTANSQGNSLKLNKKMTVTAFPVLDPLEPESSIVHIDLASYAFGWGWAVYDDFIAGNLHESSQYRRITKGLQAAITGSTLGVIKPDVDITTDLLTDSPIGGNPGTSPQIYNFPSDYNGLYYYVSSEELAHNGNLNYPTHVYLGPSNKYYYNSGLTCLLPDGIYFPKSSGAYYKVVNGLVTEIGSKPTILPGGDKPIQHIIDNLFPVCN